MHAPVIDFLRKIRGQVKSPCLELGSLNINGTPRSVFKVDVGIDLNMGKDVDVIANAHDLPFTCDYFNTVVSTEMLEHDPDPQASIREAFRVLRPGGLLVMTAATDKRPPHEIWVTGHYHNISRDEIEPLLNMLSIDWHVEGDEQDIRFYARKSWI